MKLGIFCGRHRNAVRGRKLILQARAKASTTAQTDEVKSSKLGIGEGLGDLGPIGMTVGGSEVSSRSHCSVESGDTIRNGRTAVHSIHQSCKRSSDVLAASYCH
jgi:hypothetical protein